MKSNHLIEQEELMAYLDGELTTDRAAAAVAHLERCPECQELAAALRSVSEQMREWQVGESKTTIPDFDVAFEENPKPQPMRPIRRIWQKLNLRLSSPRVWGFAGVGLSAVVLLAVISTIRFSTLTATKSDSDGRFFSGAHREEPQQPAVGDELQTDKTARLKSNNYDAFSTLGLSTARHNSAESKPGAGGAGGQSRELPIPTGPMIIRTAALTLTSKDFDKARAGIEAALWRHRGYVGELNVGGTTGSARTLNAKLRVPADQLDAFLSELKQLGHVDAESQSGEEVTQQYVDLQARIDNAKHTEQRLTDILRERTGKLSDVLEVEEQIDSVRGEIERMEAERKNLANQVSFATLNATLNEEYKTPIDVVPLSTSTRLHNAAVEGYQTVVNGIITLLLFLASAGPTILIWCAILFFPVRAIWRKIRKLTTDA